LFSAFTNALNKISDVNQARVVAAVCEELVLESVEDAQLIISELYHRVVRDGGDCFFQKYVCIFKALREGHPDLFEAAPFPTTWACCEQLLSSLLEQEARHFLNDIDQGQRNRCIALSIMRLFGHLSLQGLCDHQPLIRELLDPTPTGMRATCRKGISLHSLLAPYHWRHAHEVEFQLECACTLLEVIGPTWPVADPGGFKVWCVKRLTRLHTRKDTEPTTTRGHILIHNFLELDWVAERRIDPSDGKPYTLREMMKFYAGNYLPQEIEEYFMSSCVGIGEVVPRSAFPQYGRRTNRRRRRQR